MDASRLVLLAAAVLVMVPVGHAQDDDAVAARSAQAPGPAKPWKQVRGLGRVLDLGKPPVVIDEPGLYAIQQNWRFPRATTEVCPELIQITADGVTLDLHGFTVAADNGGPPPSTLFVITGDSAEIRNGGIEAGGINAAFAVHSTRGPWLHQLSVVSPERGMTFEGDGTTISDSQITGPIQLGGRSNLERNTIRSAGAVSVWLAGDGNHVTDNRIFPFRADAGVVIRGHGNVVANNVTDVTDAPVHVGFRVEGDHNVLRSNVLVTGSTPTSDPLWQVSGTGNTLDGNIAAPAHEQERQATAGMEFTADGNYYGDNRMAAQVPFSLGGTVQTDWGGNVGY
jgi:hypothetical protein